MIAQKKDEAAAPEIEQWAGGIARKADAEVQVSVYYDGDSSTYVLRLARGMRVLLFRLSEAQVQTPAREAECEKILLGKIDDLRK
jgi:hypothetical protein